ncbi:undecaprenyl diphosphate synthase family protein, partial [Pantoea sp. SIMBA_133]
MPSENPHTTDDPQGTGPRPVAIIMDGNGRWAKDQGKLRISGNKAGVKAVRRAVSFA